MDIGQPVSRSDLAGLCPLSVLGHVLDDMADAAEPATDDGRPDTSLAATARQTIANALRRERRIARRALGAVAG